MDARINTAGIDDSNAILELSAVVQHSLQVSGSHQVFGPFEKTALDYAISQGFCYVLKNGADIIGYVKVMPMMMDYPHHLRVQDAGVRQPFWLLQSLMIDPCQQGNDLGLRFLHMLLDLDSLRNGTIVLDCWAGNQKLKNFYQRAGFKELGDEPEDDYFVTVFAKEI